MWDDAFLGSTFFCDVFTEVFHEPELLNLISHLPMASCGNTEDEQWHSVASKHSGDAVAFVDGCRRRINASSVLSVRVIAPSAR